MVTQAWLVVFDWGILLLWVALFDAEGVVFEECGFVRGIFSVALGEFFVVFESVCGDWLRGGAAYAIIGGMAGSCQGWLEAVYCVCFVGFAEIAAHFAWIERGRIAIVSGLSCETAGVLDVMCGEEVQILGVFDLLNTNNA